MNRRYLLLKRYRFPLLNTLHQKGEPRQPAGVVNVHLRSVFWRAYRRGYKIGLKHGLDDGLAQGREKGYETGFKDGQGKGYRSGFEQGFQTGKSEAERLLSILNRLWRHLSGREQEFWSQMERQLVNLIREICQKVVLQELRISIYSLEQLVQETLTMLPGVDDLRITVNPKDRPVIERLSDRYPEQWQIITDSSITQGGCLLQAGSGDADARVETRLNRCLEEVEEILEEQATGTISQSAET